MNNDERTLSLADLFSILLRNIVPIICVTLAFTLLGFVYSLRESQASSSPPTVQSQQEIVDKTQEHHAFLADIYKTVSSTMEDLEDEKLSYLWESVGAANEKMSHISDYCSSSPIMALDPYQCTVIDVSLLVRSNNSANNSSIVSVGDQAASVISSICTMDNSVLEKLRQVLDVEQDLDYVRQLINVFSDRDIVHIRLYCSDKDSAQTAVDYLCGTVTDRLRSRNVGFSVEEISRYAGVIVDNELREQQMNMLNEASQTILALTDVENALSDLNSTMSKLRTAASDLEDKYKSSAQKPATIQATLKQTATSNQSRSVSLKTVALFFILGLFISCFSVLCFWLLSGKFTSQNELINRYAFPVLGVLPGEKKKLFGNTIKRLEGESNSSFEDVAKVVAQALFRVSENHSVCFVSSLGGENASALLPYLDGKIGVCGDILNDPEAVKALKNYDSIILIEQRRKSVLCQIDSEVLRAKAFGKDILGIVLI